MKKLICIAIAILAISMARSQKPDGAIKGVLTDTSARKPITDATISVLKASDSSLFTYTLSKKNGVFEIKDLPQGRYRVIISHQEYAEASRVISITTTQKLVDFHE